MAEAPQTPVSGPSSLPQTIPQKRALGMDDKHAPAVASPLNPDLSASRTRTRDQREKKATFKARGLSPDAQQSKKNKKLTKDSSVLSPIRYKLPTPKPADFDAPKPPIFIPTLVRAGRQYYEATEHVFNKKGFRYSRCICDPGLPSSQYHRQSEAEPYGPRISYEDSSSLILYDLPGRSITTERGFRLARANVGAREGRWYWECKILSGVKSPDQTVIEGQESGGHVRVGWARREASLDGPVGFDAYSYGLRDVGGQKVHMSRPKDFMSPTSEDFCEGDVLGLEITLPSLSLHRKVTSGVYNKAVDVSDDLDPTASSEFDHATGIRDRVPIRYKTHLYFEQFEYHPSKDLEELMNPAPVPSTTTTAVETDPPNPNHPQPPLRTLPFSSIRVYKNGQLIGTPFTDLLAFLPPASKPLNTAGAREGLDDGMLGYFPAVSVFRGGAAEANFGPEFWYPPPELAKSEDVEMGNTSINSATERSIVGAHSRLRPMSERFNEQTAEDVVFDIIDEVDFWAQDGGETEGAMKGLSEAGPTVLGPVDPEAPEVVAAAADAGGTLGNGTGEIKEIVQEDE